MIRIFSFKMYLCGDDVSPPFAKGGQGGFSAEQKTKSPSIPLFQRGKQANFPKECLE